MINLLPWRAQKLQQNKRKFLLILIASIITTTIMAGFSKLLLYQQFQSITQLTDQQQHRLVQEQTLYSQLLTQLKTIHIAQFHSETLRKQQQMLQALSQIAILLPNNSYLTTLIWQNQQLIVEGILLSSSQEALKNFLNLLQNKHALNITLLKTNLVQMQKIIFKFILTLLKEKSRD